MPLSETVRPWVPNSLDRSSPTEEHRLLLVEEPIVEVPMAPNLLEIAAAAHAEGFEEGYSEGLRLAEEQQKDALARIAQLAEDSRCEANELLHSLDGEVFDLSLLIAAKIVEREVHLDKELVLEITRRALDEVRQSLVTEVRVSPQDHAIVAAHWGTLHPSLSPDVALVPDEEIQPGGCVIETRTGRIDAQISTKLSQVSEALRALFDEDAI